MNDILSCHIVGYIFDNCRKLVRCLVFQESFQKSIFDINQQKKKFKKEEEKRKEKKKHGDRERKNMLILFIPLGYWRHGTQH